MIQLLKIMLEVVLKYQHHIIKSVLLLLLSYLIDYKKRRESQSLLPDINPSFSINDTSSAEEDKPYKYFATALYHIPPYIFYSENKSTGLWDCYNTYYNDDGYPYFTNGTTCESSWNDPREGTDWFYAPEDSYPEDNEYTEQDRQNRIYLLLLL